MKATVLAGILLAVAAPAAAEFSGDHNGAAQIARGDYAAAERVLLKSLRVDAQDSELLLNLATVYARTNRGESARTLYIKVLGRPDERLSTGDGDAQRAHVLARAGLSRLPTISLALR